MNFRKGYKVRVYAVDESFCEQQEEPSLIYDTAKIIKVGKNHLLLMCDNWVSYNPIARWYLKRQCEAVPKGVGDE